MKDENDKVTLELVPSVQGKYSRFSHQLARLPPVGAKSESPFLPLGFARSVVSVSIVAREWGISSRRVRMMLTQGRLNGRQLENGYWEVFYPYSYVFGTRGPAIKRQRSVKPKNQERI